MIPALDGWTILTSGPNVTVKSAGFFQIVLLNYLLLFFIYLKQELLTQFPASNYEYWII